VSNNKHSMHLWKKTSLHFDCLKTTDGLAQEGYNMMRPAWALVQSQWYCVFINTIELYWLQQSINILIWAAWLFDHPIFCVGVATPIVAAFFVGLQVSCRVSSRGPRIVEYHRKWLSLNPKSSPRLEPSTVFGFVTLVPVMCSPKQFCSLRRSIVLSFRATKTFFIGTRTQDSFQVCDLSSCNLLAETNKFCLGALLISCLVSEVQEPS
jgi:hypothetical protein